MGLENFIFHVATLLGDIGALIGSKCKAFKGAAFRLALWSPMA